MAIDLEEDFARSKLKQKPKEMRFLLYSVQAHPEFLTGTGDVCAQGPRRLGPFSLHQSGKGKFGCKMLSTSWDSQPFSATGQVYWPPYTEQGLGSGLVCHVSSVQFSCI